MIVNEHCEGCKNIFFTDGAKTDDFTSAAVYHQRYELTYRLPRDCSVFEAEAYAVLKAMKLIYHNLERKSIIATDSLSTLRAIASTKHPTKSNNIIRSIKSLSRKLRIDDFKLWLVWVPSHCGINGNERADELTKHCNQSMNTESIGYSDQQEIKTNKNNMLSLWQHQWEQSDKGRYLHFIQNKVSTKLVANKSLSKEEQKIINRLKTGHGCFKAHLNRIQILNSNICDCNESEETLDHILWDCQHYDRTDLLAMIVKEGFTTPYNIQIIMMNIESSAAVMELIRFFKNNKIKL